MNETLTKILRSAVLPLAFAVGVGGPAVTYAQPKVTPPVVVDAGAVSPDAGVPTLDASVAGDSRTSYDGRAGDARVHGDGGAASDATIPRVPATQPVPPQEEVMGKVYLRGCKTPGNEIVTTVDGKGVQQVCRPKPKPMPKVTCSNNALTVGKVSYAVRQQDVDKDADLETLAVFSIGKGKNEGKSQYFNLETGRGIPCIALPDEEEAKCNYQRRSTVLNRRVRRKAKVCLNKFVDPNALLGEPMDDAPAVQPVAGTPSYAQSLKSFIEGLDRERCKAEHDSVRDLMLAEKKAHGVYVTALGNSVNEAKLYDALETPADALAIRNGGIIDSIPAAVTLAAERYNKALGKLKEYVARVKREGCGLEGKPRSVKLRTHLALELGVYGDGERPALRSGLQLSYDVTSRFTLGVRAGYENDTRDRQDVTPEETLLPDNVTYKVATETTTLPVHSGYVGGNVGFRFAPWLTARTGVDAVIRRRNLEKTVGLKRNDRVLREDKQLSAEETKAGVRPYGVLEACVRAGGFEGCLKAEGGFNTVTKQPYGGGGALIGGEW